jgi:hypothetical protein|nr:MAG TPA: hypothetical protein [Caudoviricetes sp.]
MTREEKIDLIYFYHRKLGNQSWLQQYIDSCEYGHNLNTMQERGLNKILAYMEDDYADL